MTTHHLILRNYQKKIVERIEYENAIIKMPTGSGKTFVAAELIKIRLGQYASKKAIFFVPTVDLVDQQAFAIESWLGPNERVARYHGDMSRPMMNMHRILVSTPSSFLALQENEDTIIHWQNCCICIFDEVHHVLKEHPYRKIASNMAPFVQFNPKSMQIIGLSASLTYAVVDQSIEKALEGLCVDLFITKMCSPTPDELIAGGYVPKRNSIEILDGHWTPDGTLPEWAREPHKMYESFLSRIENRNATAFSLLLWDTIKLMEEHLSSIHGIRFTSPLNQNKLSNWAKYACTMKNKYNGQYEYFQQLENMYVGLKIIVGTWEEEEPLAMHWLLRSGATRILNGYRSNLIEKLEEINILTSNEGNHSQLNALIGQLHEKNERFGTDFRCIVFVQQRICAYVVAQCINNTESLSRVGMKAGYIAAKNTAITPSIKVTPSHSEAILQQFRDGTINVLVATSVAEEGIDVAAANVVISYNHMKDTVEFCQRAGRARRHDCCFVVLEERKDRPVALLQQVEERQERIISNFDPSNIISKRRKVHEARISLSNSNSFSSNHNSSDHNSNYNSIENSIENHVSLLNIYCQKTRAQLSAEDVAGSSRDMFSIQLTYATSLRTVRSVGIGKNKKSAKQDAAKILLDKLK